MVTLLFLIALVIAVYGVVRIVQGDILWGVVLLILAAAIGPGGWSIWR